jgi:hypothetical protein
MPENITGKRAELGFRGRFESQDGRDCRNLLRG